METAIKVNDNLENKVDEFSNIVREEFSFLTDNSISVSSLVEFVTNGELKDPLPRFGSKTASARKINKARREREKLIDENLRGIVATYADWLQEYGGEILEGDASIFERVQKYATEKLAENYYGY